MSKPITVGITGGIGAGKSIVCEVFRVLKVPVYQADDRAKGLMVEDENVISKIKHHFGKGSYHASGGLNRIYLARAVFNDQEKIKILNGIVHPAVEADFNSWIDHNKKHPYILKEAALLIETGSYKKLDFLIVITAPEEVRIQRVLKRDAHRTPEDVKAIISSQLAEEIKVAKAKFVLANDNKSLLMPQILYLHQFFNNLRQTG